MHDLNENAGIQSIDYTAQVLELFCKNQSRLSLKEVALQLNESPAKIFRYLVSLTRIGLLHKTENNEYEVGSLALDLSFRALNALDPVEEACKTAKAINYETGFGTAVSIWGSLGPTVIKTFDPSRSVYSQIRVGSVMTLVNSSIGNTFAKYIPEHLLKQALDQDSIRSSGQKLSQKEKQDFLQRIKAQREEPLTVMIDRPSRGLSSISIPVFSISEEVQFVITIFHVSDLLLEQQEQIQDYLCAKILELSKSIGAN